MKFLKRFIAGTLLISFTAFCLAHDTSTITPKEAGSYIGKSVSVQGTVVRVSHSTCNDCCLNFSKEKGGITVVINQDKCNDMTLAGIDVNSMGGKTVIVTGQIMNDPQYGIEMKLTNPANLVLYSIVTSGVKYSKGIISPEDAPKHLEQNVTIQGKVLSVDVSNTSGTAYTTGTTYTLRFTTQKNGFSAVIFPFLGSAFKKANIDLKSYVGKTVQVNGTIKFYQQYGYEIILYKAENIKEVK